MDASKIAQWMREEHDKVEDLSNRLKERVAVVPRANLGNWINEVRDRFEHFRAHLIKHMALEESEGYLIAVTERRPTLSREVERLEHEHRELEKIMEGIHHAFSELAADDRLLVRDCCARIDKLLAYIERHEDDENLLVTQAFARDIGTND